MRRLTKKTITVTAFVSAAALSAGIAAFALDMTAPSMPSISSPTMPSLSSQSMTMGWYRPQFNGQNVAAPQASKRASAVSEQRKTTTVQLYGESLAPVASASANPTMEMLSALGSVSAADVSRMGKLGMLGNLLGTGSAASTVSADNTVVLSQILTELNNLKAQLNKPQTLAEKNTPPSGADSSGLLRFIVNGINLREACRSVYISTPEADGSFLFTTDRSGTNPETVYFLFTPAKSQPGLTQFNVEVDVNQFEEDTASPLYQITQGEALIAVKTGNLMSIRSRGNGLQLDLLLDTGRNLALGN